jgi:hypothetical protein
MSFRLAPWNVRANNWRSITASDNSSSSCWPSPSRFANGRCERHSQRTKGLKKNALDGLLAAEILWDLEALLGRQSLDDLDLEALETAIRRQALRLAGRAVEQRINADQSDGGKPHARCECGQLARYAGRREKTFESVLGQLKLERAYYYCAACGHGFCPRDRQLGLEDTSLSPAVTRMVAAVGALVSFEEGSQLLQELAGVSVNAKQVERAAEGLGVEIGADEKRDMTPVLVQPLPSTLYLGVDGTGVPMRAQELKGRSGKQPDGSAKTREVKLCTVWSAESRDDEDRPVRDEGSVSYTAAIESAATLDVDEVPSAFTQRVLREASRRRFTQAERTVVIGDGAPWIWKIAQELFPRAIQIVDRFHVKQTLCTVSKAVYGADSPQAHQWARRRHDELDAGKFTDLLRAVRRHSANSADARKCFQYLHRNRDRMRYPHFEALGLCTSSGVVEAGCKVVVGTRLKRAGMHWTLRGSNAIIALRCSRLSGRFQDFWERRADARRAA